MQRGVPVGTHTHAHGRYIKIWISLYVLAVALLLSLLGSHYLKIVVSVHRLFSFSGVQSIKQFMSGHFEQRWDDCVQYRSSSLSRSHSFQSDIGNTHFVILYKIMFEFRPRVWVGVLIQFSISTITTCLHMHLRVAAWLHYNWPITLLVGIFAQSCGWIETGGILFVIF